MRKDITIEAQSRETRGKNASRRLRASGLAPAVLYGGDKEPVAITIVPKEINKILSSATGHNTIFNLDVGAPLLHDGTPGRPHLSERRRIHHPLEVRSHHGLP